MILWLSSRNMKEKGKEKEKLKLKNKIDYPDSKENMTI